MDTVSVFVIVVATAAICVILMQAYAVYENYDNILEFNAAHAALEYASTVGGPQVDRRAFDPNDEATDAKAKWRCVLKGSVYVSASLFGFRAEGGRVKLFPDEESCQDFTFTPGNAASIINPCAPPRGPGDADCVFLKSVI
ncbi:IMV surface protein [Squirrelpox virus]|uniref:IMV surface protein n=1 Tax=Squirrelpox virus TaxID=240426 RepID=Q1HTR8_9POXV|nr:IMV surface protein [Squirrelpox virus]ABD51468.1 O3L [Squirrelpox virus]CCD83300.1 IMV surface protein [Squirrelpox virus]